MATRVSFTHSVCHVLSRSDHPRPVPQQMSEEGKLYVAETANAGTYSFTALASHLSGGNNPATTQPFIACPYRATSSPRYRPQGFRFYRGGNYSDTGG